MLERYRKCDRLIFEARRQEAIAKALNQTTTQKGDAGSDIYLRKANEYIREYNATRYFWMPKMSEHSVSTKD